MANLVTFPDGTKANFDRIPTPQEKEFAWKKVQAERSRKAQEASLNEKPPETVMEKVADFTGGKKIGQGLGQALYNTFGGADKAEQTLNDMIDTQSRILTRIKEKKTAGEDTARLQNALDILNEDIQSYAKQTGKILNNNDLTGKEVLGDALQLAVTVGTAGTVGAKGAQAGKLVTKALPSTIKSVVAKDVTGGLIKEGLKGAGKGALKGAGEGALIGAGEGVAEGLKNNEDLGGVIDSAIQGGIVGTAFGGVLGGTIGGTTGAIKGKKLSDALIKAQEESGLRTTLDKTIIEKTKIKPEFGSMVDEAKKQGFSDKEINFLGTVKDADKPVLEKMYDVTAKAQSNPRQIQRASDILGDNASNIVKQVKAQNKEFGKAVDTTAKALKGQIIDAQSVRDTALASLEDVGVIANPDGTPNWSKSIFSKTPELQKKLMDTLSDLPAGQMDAYDLHKFKKSIDEVVEYGVGGEGLKGKSASLLKAIRAEADNVLDTNFADYNTANTEFKATRDVLDRIEDVVGSKVNFETKAGGQTFGQAFRSAFSNNKSRPKTLALIEELQAVAKQRKLKGAEQDLLDQAIYVNMLEDIFGSQASTGLASEVRKGVETAKKIKGSTAFETAVNLGTEAYERTRNITPEAKKALLKKFLE